ncbi:hypothetical protein [Methylophaga sp.]|uniref:hypothetical protein n=1 Tax=Methylophaga sp. TaxID=2024840 RepID=UPI003A8F9AF6
MNLQQAKAELSQLANGEFHMVRYRLTEFQSGRQEQECEVYIDGDGIFSAPTFRQSLNLLKKARNPKREIVGKAKPQKSVVTSITDAPRTTVQQYIDLKAAQ